MAKNVIIMIGDGMGWEITRAAAIQKLISEGAMGETLADFYTQGKGFGLGFQNLASFAIATNTGTYIDGNKENSALKGNPLNRETGKGVIRKGYENLSQYIYQQNSLINETPIVDIFDPSCEKRALFWENQREKLEQISGVYHQYDLSKGRNFPWQKDKLKDYVKNNFPDSANTATTLYTGVKSYNSAIGVDIYEEDVKTVAQKAREVGKSFGVVTSVPFNHATPAAAIGHVNHRNKLNEELVDAKNDNILSQILDQVQPEVILGGGHPEAIGHEGYIDLGTLEKLRNGETVYSFTERGKNAAATLAEIASSLNVNEGDKLFGVYGARGQGGNLPWLTADEDYSNTGLSSRLDVKRPLAKGETVEEFIASEINANPTLADMAKAALDVLEDNEKGFWLMIEGGDIDWAMHDNNINNAIGAVISFNNAFEVVDEWIKNNGGYEENLLIVTADHDHYLTLNENFPALIRDFGAKALTTAVDENGNPIIIQDADGNSIKKDNPDPIACGHYWGSDPDLKYGWANHTRIPVPVYFQGNGSDYIANSVGKGFEQYGFQVAGLSGLTDQVHIANTMFEAIVDEVEPRLQETIISAIKDNYFDSPSLMTSNL